MHRYSIVPFAWLLLPGLLGLAGCPGDDGLTNLESEMSVSPTALSFGPVYQGDTRTLLIAVDNTGTAPLLFGNLSPEAENGPASISLRASQPRLEAGESTSVEVRITANTMGAGVYTARVELATERGPSETITIDAEIRPLPECDDQNPCTNDSSDNGVCTHTPAINGSPCDDGSACTFATVCVESTCVGQPVECADSVGCTVDYCSPDTGCVFEPMNDQCDDGDGCTLDTCNGLVGCLNEPAPIGTVCHLDGCNEIGFCIGTGCAVQPTPDGVPCEDGDFCTVDDKCVAQTCTAGELKETGAADPLVVADATFTFDLCLDQDVAYLDCQFFGSGGVVAEAPAGEVLATHTGSDGRSLVLWRTAWVSPFGPCSPGTDGSVGGGPPVPPEDPNDPNNGADAPPDPPNICGSGIFLTQTDPLTGASAARHLTTAVGLTAGAFALDTTGHMVVATAALDNVVTTRVFSLDPNDVDAFPGQTSFLESRGPLGALSVDIEDSRVAVLMTPAFRNAYATPAACGDQCSCNCDDVDLCYCEGGSPEVLVMTETLGGFGVTTLHTLPLLEYPDDQCSGEQPTARPFHPDALMVRADDAGTFAFRLDPFACADLANAPPLDARLVYGATLESGPALLAPIPFDPETTRLADVDLRAAPLVTAIERVPDADCPDIVDVPCFDTFRVVNGQLGDAGGGVIGAFETLIDNLGPGPASAHPIVLDDGLFTLVRTGLSTQVVRHDPDTGLIERVAAPPLAPSTVNIDRPVTGVGQAAFVTHALCADNRAVPSPDAGPGEPLCEETTQVVVQRFGCYYGQNETGCLAHDDCEGNAVCAQGPGVCLEPPSCDGDECATCAGRCVALADCAMDDLCGPPSGSAPVCPAGTSPHYGSASDCSWACLDEACEPWSPPAVDGGPVDGGFVDGGTVDGGTVDGGFIDGGSIDGGADSGI